MLFEPPVPVLRIYALAQARAYYVDGLGFSWDWEARAAPDAPAYVQVSRAGVVLHLSEHHGDASPGAAVFVAVAGLDALQAELSARLGPHLLPAIAARAWGRELVLTDPFGNRLRFGERGVRPRAAGAPAPAGLTRAEVRAEYLRARAEGTLPPSGEVG